VKPYDLAPLAMNNREADMILADQSKTIFGDIEWALGDGPWMRFRAEIVNDFGAPLQVAGTYNPQARKVSFSILHPEVGRLYGLDLGGAHAESGRIVIQGTHKNKWTEEASNHCYVPEDITATEHEPVRAWEQFCAEAKIDHQGLLHLPSIQESIT